MPPEGELRDTQAFGIRMDGCRLEAFGQNKPSLGCFACLKVPMLGDLQRNTELFSSGFGVFLKNGVRGLSENVPWKQFIALLCPATIINSLGDN